MEVTKNVDLNKKYQLPKSIKTIFHNNCIVVIADQLANWIILSNHSQLDFFHLLEVHSINESIEEFNGDISDVKWVLTQIEAKQFFERPISLFNGLEKLHFYLTNGCNLCCPQCYMSSGKKSHGELSFDEIVDSLTAFANHNGKIVTFSGGEATLRHDLLQIVKKSHQLGLQVRLMTNGTLWNDKMVDEFAPYLSKVQVSVDGFSEFENSKIRGKGSFPKALSTIDMFLSKSVPVDMAVTPLFSNDLSNKIDLYCEFAQSLLKQYVDKPFSIQFSGEILDGREVSLIKSEKDYYSSFIEELYQKCFGFGSVELFAKSFQENTVFNNCSYGGVTISATGDVYLCAQIPSIQPIANVKTDSWADILSLAEKCENLSNINNLKPCKNCELKYICGGGCRIKFFRDFTKKDIVNKNPDELEQRICTKENKAYFLDLMIKSNNLLFRQ